MALRGSQVLFQCFEEAPVISIDRRKGRSQELNDRRNECILHRYHYHRTKLYDGKRISYESLMETVAAEFFLSTRTLFEVINPLNSKLHLLNQKWPQDRHPQFSQYCKKEWPHLMW